MEHKKIALGLRSYTVSITASHDSSASTTIRTPDQAILVNSIGVEVYYKGQLVAMDSSTLEKITISFIENATSQILQHGDPIPAPSLAKISDSPYYKEFILPKNTDIKVDVTHTAATADSPWDSSGSIEVIITFAGQIVG